jgi:hypothetical protein
MKKAKTTKKPKTLKKAKPPEVPATPVTSSVATATMVPVATTRATTVVPPRRLARLHRATATPAQRRGADLVRYLRIHAKRPYGDRGIRALVELAQEVGHLANLELNARERVTQT